MQGSNTSPAGMRANRLANRASLFALSVLLAACHAPRADPAAGQLSDATNAIVTRSKAAQQAPPGGDQPQADATQHHASAATTALPQGDANGDPYRVDDSYNRANLRAQYRQCVAASADHASAIHACMDEEFQWQDERLRQAWGAIANGPDSAFKDKLADEQHTYMSDTYQKCHYDPINKDQEQLIAALPCLTNRYANRADALEILIRNNPM